MPDKYKIKYNILKKARAIKKKKELNSEIGKYLYLSKTYDYFLYSYLIYFKRSFLKGPWFKIRDPWGKEWQKLWLKGLRKDKVFMDVMKFQQVGQKDFDKYLKVQMKGPVTENDFSEVGCDKTILLNFLTTADFLSKKGYVIGDIDNLEQVFENFKKIECSKCKKRYKGCSKDFNNDHFKNVKFILQLSKMNRWRTCILRIHHKIIKKKL